MKNINYKKGFTLVETLVAIAIIMIAITGPFATAGNSMNVATISHDKSIATFLAQEGVEYIRALRDKVYINKCFTPSGASCIDWWKVFTTNTYGNGYNVLQCLGNGCSLDITVAQYDSQNPFSSGALSLCPSTGTCGKLYINSSKEYTASSVGNSSTIFSRRIVTTSLPSNSIKVKVTVTWKEHSTDYSITATDVLTAWE